MTNGWTGGQYSLYRAILGVYLVVHFASQLARPFDPLYVFAAAGTIASACFLLGIWHRAAAVAIALALAGVAGPNRVLDVTPLVLGWLLLAHLFVPPSPYGSWGARTRSDPRGEWRMPWLTMVFFHLFVINPGWVPARWPERRDLLFYDGTCGLCHRATRFVLSEDRRGTAFTFAALDGRAFLAAIAPAARGALPDSLVIRTEDGTLMTRGDGGLYILERLGGWWRVIAIGLRLVPRAARDMVYDTVARIRYRLFARPQTVCPILPPDLRSRFRD